jgi:hypothetical protein
MNYKLSIYPQFLLIFISLVSQSFIPSSLQAATNPYCQFETNSVTTKENLRQASLKGNPKANQNYQAIVKEHAKILRQCRKNSWLQEQAIWLRLYPCDVREGAIDEILDRIVNLGYNTIYVEVFFDSQVLLPKNSNYTPWASVVDLPGMENRDLLAETIQKGRERGLKVYAWLFSLNFGYLYSQRPDRQNVLARNGKGENSLDFVHDRSQAFVDPYHPQVREDYSKLLQAVLQRRPDGVLFDYIRYPRGSGEESLVSKVKQLWIYGEASRKAFLERAQNQQGKWLLEQYITKGYIDANDVAKVKKLYPQEKTPLWQGRSPEMSNSLSGLQLDLWYFSVAHAAQGVIDFLEFASSQVESQGITAGAVFFPDGNKVVGEIGFDSRLQPWDYFAPSLEWHPMSYAICGNPNCIVEQINRVINSAAPQTKISPVLAGLWGQNQTKRPSLEAQMEAIRTQARRVNSLSHFSYSWLEPEFTRQRSSCNF